MKAKILLTAFVLVASPGIALASCDWGKSQAASCAPGAVWDSASESCVVQSTS
jgi:hypothetical protein